MINAEEDFHTVRIVEGLSSRYIVSAHSYMRERSCTEETHTYWEIKHAHHMNKVRVRTFNNTRAYSGGGEGHSRTEKTPHTHRADTTGGVGACRVFKRFVLWALLSSPFKRKPTDFL